MLFVPVVTALPASLPTATLLAPEFDPPPKAPDPTAVLSAPVPASKAKAPIAVLLSTVADALPAAAPKNVFKLPVVMASPA